MTPFLAHKDLVIFDWDDTIFPSTVLVKRRETVSGSDWARFGETALVLLTTFIERFGAENIYIVTNGTAQWVQHSLKMLSKTPSISSRMKQLFSVKLSGRVISARDLYEKMYPSQPALWKTLVFTKIATAHFGVDVNQSGTIISIGDGMDEFIASIESQKWLHAQYGMKRVNLIRVLLEQSPSTDLMLMQFGVLTQMISIFVGDGAKTSFDLRVADFIQLRSPSPVTPPQPALSIAVN